MGIETLTKAANAAGFAMAGQMDDADATPSAAAPSLVVPQEPRNTLPVIAVARTEPTMAQWLRGALGMFGRGAPA